MLLINASLFLIHAKTIYDELFDFYLFGYIHYNIRVNKKSKNIFEFIEYIHYHFFNNALKDNKRKLKKKEKNI